MKQVKNLSKKMLVSILVFAQLMLFTVASFADSYDPNIHGEAIAQYAKTYIDNNKEKLYYNTNSPDYSGQEINGKIGFVCTTFVRFIYKQAIGFDYSNPEYNKTSVIYADILANEGPFERIDPSEAKPGDLLLSEDHIMIYLGNYEVAHASGVARGVLYESGSPTSLKFVIRLRSDYDVQLLGTLDAMGGNRTDYNYYGMPQTGQYVGSKSLTFDWIINKLSQIADYLVGIMTSGLKIVLIGWGTAFEKLATFMVDEITKESIEIEEAEETTTELGAGESFYIPSAIEDLLEDSQDRLTVEKIIYNQVPVLDIDIFTQGYAAGQKLNSEGTIATIRNNIAQWYYIFRQASIIIMLVVLVYIGIRMALSTIAEKKAKYKRLLKDWFFGFAIVFFVHYFILIMIGFNNGLVDIFEQAQPNREYTIYETVRTKAYEIKFSSGLIGTAMYLYLVYLLVRFLYIYLKRYLTVNILIILAPIMGLSYAIDKVRDSKSQAIMIWAKDLFFNIIIQSVHALVYTIFVPTVLEVSEESLAGIVIAFVIMNFILKAEKIIIHIFKIDAPSLSSTLKDSWFNDAVASMQFLKTKWLKKAVAAPVKATYGLAKEIGGFAGDVGAIVIPKNVQYGYNSWYNEQMEKLWGKGNFIRRRTSDIDLQSDIEKIQEEEIRKKKELRKKIIKQNIRFGTDMAKGYLTMAAAIPIAIASPKTGITLALNSAAKFQKYTRKKQPWIKPARTRANKEEYRKTDSKKAKATYKLKSTAKVLATPVVFTVGAPVRSTWQRFEGQRENRENLFKKMEESRERAKMLEEERQLEEQLAILYAKLKEDQEKILPTGNEKLKERLKEKQEKEFNHVIDEALKDVSIEDINMAISKYMARKGIKQLAKSNLDGVLNELQGIVKKSIEFSPELKKEIEKQMQMVSNENVKKTLEEAMKKARDKNDITKSENKNIMKELEKSKVADEFAKAMEKTKDKDVLNKEFDTILKRNNVGQNLSKEAKEKIVEQVTKQKEKREKEGMEAKQVADIIKKSTRNKETIKREQEPVQYEQIVEKIEEMKKLNNLFQDKYGKPIHKNLKKTVKNLKDSKEFDAYKAIMDRKYDNKK